MNSWKEPCNTYNSSTWIFSLFGLLNWFPGLLSIGHYHRFLSAAAMLFILVIQKSSSSYERIKNEKVHGGMNESKTNTWQGSCPIKRHENDMHSFCKNYTTIPITYSALDHSVSSMITINIFEFLNDYIILKREII